MAKKHQLDPLEDHNEWVEHMYNPGYWINRVTSRHIASWRYTRRHAIREGFLAMVFCGFLIIAIAYPAIQESRSMGVPILRIMIDNFTIWIEVFFLLMFLLSAALFFRGIADRRKTNNS